MADFFIRSADGTEIAFDRFGPAQSDGSSHDPAVVLVHAAMQHRATDPATTDLARRLAERGITAVVYDRRGRGESGPADIEADTDPDVETDPDSSAERVVSREVQDVAAVIDAVGGRAALLGSSSGAVVALWAAAAGIGVERLILWEAPLSLEGEGDGGAHLAALQGLAAAGDREGLIRSYMDGMPPEWIEGLRSSPEWPAYLAAAPTLVHDAAALHEADRRPWAEQWSSVTVPALALTGEETLPFFPVVADALAGALPDCRSERIAGAGHAWDAEVMADRVTAFLAG